jgi:hypothetical protein
VHDLEDNQLSGVICLLVINKIEKMPEIAVRSILASCDEKIMIGYKEYSDVEVFENIERISLIDLSGDFHKLDIHNNDINYSGWSKDVFFQIVQLKWFLFQRALKLGFDFIIYSDLDVVWIENAFKEVQKTFAKRNAIDLQIQSFTRSSDEPQLCMGFVGMRNNENILKFVELAKVRHGKELLRNPRIGDDDIATLLYREMDFPSWVLELPQTSFPVGATFGLFSNRATFPGLRSKRPFIFHANYVVGLNNKILMLKSFLGRDLRKRFGAQFTWLEYSILKAKALKWHMLFSISSFRRDSTSE